MTTPPATEGATSNGVRKLVPGKRLPLGNERATAPEPTIGRAAVSHSCHTTCWRS